MDERARRLCGLLGLARRAGKLAVGASAVERLVHGGEKPLVVLASDAGASLRGSVERWEPVEGVALETGGSLKVVFDPVEGVVADILTSDEMAEAMGRQKLAVMAVADPGFVRGILKNLKPDEPERPDGRGAGNPARSGGSGS